TKPLRRKWETRSQAPRCSWRPLSCRRSPVHARKANRRSRSLEARNTMSSPSIGSSSSYCTNARCSTKG
ncbi:hypothetical protein BD413DRAFT_597117, partial [Trametes elegans]